MPRSGLDSAQVVEAAAKLVEQQGAGAFSMRALVESLNIQTASLYHHVKSMDVLLTEVCGYAMRMQRDAELKAMEGKQREDAVFALAEAYRRFTGEHGELYRLIIRMAASAWDGMTEASSCVSGPFLRALEGYRLTREEAYHWQRILRGVIHGFASQEDAGFFSHLPVDVGESFQMAIRTCVLGLEQAEAEGSV